MSKLAGSEDSLVATTAAPLSSSSSYIPDALTIAMERFPSSRSANQIKRTIANLIIRSREKDMTELAKEWKKTAPKQLRQLTSTLSCSGLITKTVVPHASLLTAPPRGNLTCATKDLNRELLCIRKFSPCAERTAIATRMLRTLDPTCPTHTDIALAIFLITTL